MDVKDKTILITGGARGIGAATAARLREKGARLVLTDVDEAALKEHDGPDVLTVVADVTDLASMEDAVRQGVERFGGIDVVVANAGIASYGSVAQVEPATFKRVIDVNVTGVFHTVRAALPEVTKAKGYILVVSSAAAFAASPGMAAYNASKAGAEHFANALRMEMKHQGVDVGSAHMTWIDTPLVQDAKKDLGSFREMLKTLPGPLGKTVPVEDCAKAFVGAIEGRKRRVYVPGFVKGMSASRNFLNSPLGEREVAKHAPEQMRLMDEEVRQLGRSTSERNLGQPGTS